MTFRFALLAPLLALFMALSAPAAAQDRAAIEETITAQLDAFNARDVPEAWQYASPMIQSIFGNPTNFGMMVQQGYPMVWRPEDVTFGELREIAGGLYQMVIVKDAAGNLHYLDYRMQMIDGEWRIAGVQILQAPEVSA